MNNLHWILITGICFTLAACVSEPEDIPPAFSQDPVFFANLQINGETKEIAAGLSGYELSTGHSDVAGVAEYQAYLHPESCPASCPSSVRFRFWGNNDSLDFPSSTFGPGPREFYDALADQTLAIEFSVTDPTVSIAGASYWTTRVGDHISPTQNVVLNAVPEEMIDLCYNSTEGSFGATSCISSYCFEMRAGAPCIGWLKVEKVIGGNILVEPVLSGQGPYTFDWMNGASTPFILLPLTENETRGVHVIIQGPDDCTIEINQTVRISHGIPGLCPANPGFAFNVEHTPFYQYNSVSVEYTDADGNLFSSAYGPQQTASSFEVLESEPFVASPLGFPTYKLTGSLNGTLYRADGQQALSVVIDAFAIALPYDE